MQDTTTSMGENKIPDNMCNKSPLLESDFAREVSLREQIRVMIKHIRFRLPNLLWSLPVLPLNLDQVHHLVPHGIHLPIQNCHRPLDVI